MPREIIHCKILDLSDQLPSDSYQRSPFNDEDDQHVDQVNVLTHCIHSFDRRTDPRSDHIPDLGLEVPVSNLSYVT